MVGEELFGERLVAGEDQPARIAPRVRHSQQLEIADDVLIVGGDAGERLHEIEDDLRLEAGNRLTDARQVVVDAEHFDVVPALPQRLDDVVLHLPLGLEHVDAGGVLRWHEVLVDERENTNLPHSINRWPPLCR